MTDSSQPAPNAEDALQSPQFLAALEKLGTIHDIDELEDMTSSLSLDDRALLIDQTVIVLTELYAHRPLKKTRRPADAVQRLKILRGRLDTLDHQAFHEEFMLALKSLCDSHTAYRPPPPFADLVAFLPFMVEACYDEDGDRMFIVSATLDGFDHPTFRPGVEITSWNGIPMQRAVRRNAERENGSNPAAQMALGLLYITVRWLGCSLPPDGAWVIVGYEADNQHHEIRLPWRLLRLQGLPEFTIGLQAVWLFDEQSDEDFGEEAMPDGMEDDSDDPPLEEEDRLAVNQRTAIENLTRRRLFRHDKVVDEETARANDQQHLAETMRLAAQGVRGAALNANRAEPLRSALPRQLEARIEKRGDVNYGYIRIRAFLDHYKRFVPEFRRLLGQMPQSGLIIDVRDNPGGEIQSAESLLQLLTPKTVTPEPFQFVSSRLTDQLTHPQEDIGFAALRWRKRLQETWGGSIDIARATGGLYSTGAPLTSPVIANRIGQEYYGPVVLITSAGSYSSADIFAAGFQDHEIGPVIGVDPTTGAGGGNVWRHLRLTQRASDLAPEVRELPQGTQLRFAVRRCLRVGKNVGDPVEELGVVADHWHRPTYRDLTEGNRDLMDFAIKKLNEMPRRNLDVQVDRIDDKITVTSRMVGLDSVYAYVDDRPAGGGIADSEGCATILIPSAGPQTRRIELQAYSGDNLAAKYKCELAAPASVEATKQTPV
ncbi:MAG: S41 family peptidase [Pseudomonadota bacterium]